jgi:membrane protein DedA with SNARE-associated domain
MSGLEQHLVNLVKDFLTTVGYPGVFLLMAVEGFGIPIPSELTMSFGGFLASSAGGDKFALVPVIVAGALGEIAGGALAYALGFFGGRPLLLRYGRYVLLSEAELNKGEAWFGRYGSWVVLVTRMLPAIRSFIAFPAGVVRMPFWQFLLFSAIGSTIWCTLLAITGHTLGDHWQTVSNDIRPFDVPIAILLVLLIGFAVYKRVSAVRRESSTKTAVPVD